MSARWTQLLETHKHGDTMVQRIGRTAFISYRSRDVGVVRRFKEEVAGREFQKIHYIEPGELAESNEILPPFEYFELVEQIANEVRLHKVDAFIILETGQWWDSVFTFMERAQWRRFSNGGVVHIAEPTLSGSARLVRTEKLEPFDRETHRILNTLSRATNPRLLAYGGSTTPTTGPYSRSAYLVPCPRCRQYFLARRKSIVQELKRLQPSMTCPFCRYAIPLREGRKRALLRNRAVLLGEPAQGIGSPSADILWSLLWGTTAEPPTGIPLV